jgi:Lon protease-like protein
MWHDPPSHPAFPEQIPVFPLPNLVFFPGTVIPLHIFEPRYRQMVQEVLAGDGVLALALLKSGWEEQAQGAPDIHSIACAGRLLEVTHLPEGRFNIRMAGLGRVRLDEFESDKPYRQAQVSLLAETLPDEKSLETLAARSDLLGAYGLLVSEITGRQSLGLEGAQAAPFHALVNTLCAHLDMPSRIKQELLEVDDIMERGLAVTDVLRRELQRLSRRNQDDDSEGGGSTVH